MESNDQKKKLPTLEITWDASTYDICLNFKEEDFKNWEFVIAILEMAKIRADQTRKQTMLLGMQQAAETAALRKKIMRG